MQGRKAYKTLISCERASNDRHEISLQHELLLSLLLLLLLNDFLFHASKIYIDYSRRGNTNKDVCAAWYKLSTKRNYRQ